MSATELSITSVIDEGTVARVTSALATARGRLAVTINSPGGSVVCGLAIFDALRAYRGGQVVTTARGLAASMASVIFLAGDRRAIEPNAMLMIHNPWTITTGDADAHRETADLLDKLNLRLRSIYSERTELSEDAVTTMMDKETWLDATEAVSAGFAHEVSAPAPAKAEVQPAGAWSRETEQALLTDTIAALARAEEELGQTRRQVSLLEGLCGVRGVDPAEAVAASPVEFGQRPGEASADFIRRTYAEMPQGPARIEYLQRHKAILFSRS